MPQKQKNNTINWYKKPFLRNGLLLMFVFAPIIQVVNFSTAHAADSTVLASADVLLSATNVEREKQHLAPLAMNESLSSAAALKAADMLHQQYWAHVGPDGSTPWKWVKEAGYRYSYAGENLAKNFRTPDEITAAWMASPEHRANILDAHYEDAGFASTSGTLNGTPVILTVALYGAPSATAVATSVTSTVTDGKMDVVERMNSTIQSIGMLPFALVTMLLVGTAAVSISYAYRNFVQRRQSLVH